MDNGSTYETWEEKLDALLCPVIGFQPAPLKTNRYVQPLWQAPQKSAPSAPKPMPEWEKAIRRSIPQEGIEDNRSKGGAFWVTIDRYPIPLLLEQGFKYKSGKGWWKE